MLNRRIALFGCLNRRIALFGRLRGEGGQWRNWLAPKGEVGRFCFCFGEGGKEVRPTEVALAAVLKTR